MERSTKSRGGVGKDKTKGEELLLLLNYLQCKIVLIYLDFFTLTSDCHYISSCFFFSFTTPKKQPRDELSNYCAHFTFVSVPTKLDTIPECRFFLKKVILNSYSLANMYDILYTLPKLKSVPCMCQCTPCA